ncbi:hypothetical protein AB205_0088760, partial [Aquarana catesbeiana]
MSRKVYTPEEAYQILSLTDESNGELSPLSSDSGSGSEYEPPKGSTPGSESEEEAVRPKRRRSEHQAATSSASSGRPQEEGPSTSAARPQEERPSTSACQRSRAQTHLPDSLANPLWLPSTTGSATIPPFTAQPGVQVNTAGFSQMDFLNLFFPNEFIQGIVDQTNLFAQQFITTNPSSSYARPFEWRPLTVVELKLFLGLTLNMGLTKKMKFISIGRPNPSTICQFFHQPC